ncbi:MAG: M42 family metallopeptidase [Lachnospiraceae bacterium]
MQKYIDYILEQAKAILAIDSPSGFTKNVADYVMGEYEKFGYGVKKTNKGGVLAHIPGKDIKDGLMLTAHIDTLGGMVAEIKSDGRLRITPIGGLNANNVEGENCKIYTVTGEVYEGTCQLVDASIHVNGKYDEVKRTFDTIEVVLDEKVFSKDETKKLGIENGDYVCVDPRTVITKSGYIKSRFLDDKLSAAILLGQAKYLKECGNMPERDLYHYFTVFEEVGHGASASTPANVTEIISVDMGCVGEGLECTEHQVSICSKDSRSPYHYDVVKKLILAARENKIDYAVDVYPYYGSDADVALVGGADCKHGLIGPGIYASHGYERSHIDGVENTFRLLEAYVK